MKKKRFSLKEVGYVTINSWHENIIDNSYSKEDELFILKSKKNGMPTKQIAEILNRPYWGLVDKLRRMKKQKI